ncbi:hypothetical protein F4553_004912 [Allocatelliglobosispora scoriae]|uniref:Uncharacterized protein n=1 Tax=Allocatelliglobosispora scoriae TaxID=643052 RepID=A0A841BX87_9ACTN|nr:hypothetical protein [Allocatelliglobosispora scoriae]
MVLDRTMLGENGVITRSLPAEIDVIFGGSGGNRELVLHGSIEERVPFGGGELQDVAVLAELAVSHADAAIGGEGHLDTV